LKTLVLGMGNPILRDDAVGLRVVEALEGLFRGPDVTFAKTSTAGLGLIDLFDGFDRAILIDSIQTGDEPGKVVWLTAEDFVSQQTPFHIHNLDFFQTLSIGKALYRSIPEKISIVAIEATDTSTFSEGLSPEVEKAVPRVVEQILAELYKAT